MNELNVCAISGLYNEYYDLDYKSLSSSIGEDYNINCIAHINSIFWKEVFSETNRKHIYEKMSQDNLSYRNLKFQAAYNNWDFFEKGVLDSLYFSAFHDLDAKGFYSALETLNIYCELYSEYISYPHKLTLQEGFAVNEVSSDSMIDIVLNTSRNPYYEFIRDNCLDTFIKYNPDIIWLNGKIRLSSLTQVVLAKKYNPEVHISILGHSSEYYSLNKITEYLKQNKRLFQIIDSIILNDDKETMKKLYAVIKNKEDLGSINNLLYIDHNTGEINQTKYSNSILNTNDWISRRNKDMSADKEIASYNLLNMRIWPNANCFWNKCTFCGINKKYVNINDNLFDNVVEKIDLIKRMREEDGKFYWFIDEAVPPNIINEIAQQLLNLKIDIIWQIRSRVDYLYQDLDFALLYRSGLREIRLGLESANDRIRKLMKKFSKEINNNYIEELVKKFNDNCISVHFPIIIGFPTETNEERLETYNFLKNLRNKYPLVTFNINILGLDVSSELFQESYKYGISEIRWQCDPRGYIGNLVDFSMSDKSFDYYKLDSEREDFMRKVLYPWMPANSIMPVSIFYRLSETSRNTLIWKYKNPIDKELLSDSVITLSENLSYIMKEKNEMIIYNLKTHHQIYCSDETMSLIKILNGSIFIASELIEKLMLNIQSNYDWTDYWEEIKTLNQLGFIQEVEDE